jgi:hypothetical protein
MKRVDKGDRGASNPETKAMKRQSPLAAAIRRFVYGAIVGVFVDLLIIWATEDWHRWQTPTQLVANVLLVAVFGLMIQLFQKYPFAGPTDPRKASPCQCHGIGNTPRFSSARASPNPNIRAGAGNVHSLDRCRYRQVRLPESSEQRTSNGVLLF